jgi:hypothetical protein
MRSVPKQHRNALDRLGLPPYLIEFIRDDCLEEAIAEAYAQYDALLERADAWEAANPDLAGRLPWYEAREAWKRAGRPRAQWWEVLRWFGTKHERDPVPITKKEVSQYLLGEHLRDRPKKKPAQKP